MSTAYAVAAVTAVLRDRIRSRLVQAGVGAVTGSVEVSAIAPDHVDVGAAEPSRLNLFLHHVTLNQGWRNEGQPERDSNGRRLTAPPLALDLHYLLTAYGAEPYHAEILLGHAGQELHENPVLTREQIRAALAPAVPDPTLPGLVASSNLADQLEGLRIVPTAVPPDEMSRLWTALEAHYRPTISFQVGVVLIDNEAAASPGLPVLLRGPAVEPFRRPLVEAVENAAGADEPVLAASTIRLRGRRLGGPGTSVLVGDQPAAPAGASDTELTVDLGALATPPTAGLVPVQVVQSVDLGDPPVPHAALSSEPVGLVVRPAATFARAITSTVTVDGEDVHGGTITATVDPAVLRRQRVVVLLNERGAPATRPARSFAFPAPDGNGLPATTPSTTTVTVEFAGVPSGTYVARVSVDGVDSVLAVGADGRFEQPQVVLP
jgi:Pvc16 N-terminal domain